MKFLILSIALSFSFQTWAGSNKGDILGNIDGFVSRGDGSYWLRGWACAKGYSESIQIHIYRDGSAGQGQIVGAFPTNQANEPAVNSACSASGNHRFQVEFTKEMVQQYRGQSLYIHGISLSGKANSLIAGSGQNFVPIMNGQGQPPPLPGGISASYVPPTSKQGVGDPHDSDTDDITVKRYQRYQQFGAGYRQYNYWWSALESAGVAPAAQTVTCPSGHLLVPANEKEKNSRGFHRYHCYHQGTIQKFDRVMKLDAQFGLQSGVVLWSTPEQFRHPGCTGFPWGTGTLKEGCVPRDEAMNDFEDFVNFLAWHHNGKNNAGKISHFIVWNENASGAWFDMSPLIRNRGEINNEEKQKWIKKYADMMRRTHEALRRHSEGVMIYVSTDMIWDKQSRKSNDISHIGSKELLRGMWQELGISMPWSVAVHPYGNVDKEPRSDNYSFYNLEKVSRFQKDQLRSLGLPELSFAHPQAYLIASEQGWPQSDGIEKQAKNICLAHNKSMSMPEVIAQAHNYFHSVEPAEVDASGRSAQGAFYGLLPYRTSTDLSNMFEFATGQAFASTNPQSWGKSNDHYCCKKHRVGCR